jgi:hypothetical protein
LEISFGFGVTGPLPSTPSLGVRPLCWVASAKGVGCFSFVEVAFLLVDRGCLFVPFGCLQRTATAGDAAALVSLVRENVVGRRLRQRQQRRLDLQRIASGGFSMARATWCGTTSGDGTSNDLGQLTQRQRLHAREEVTRGRRSSTTVDGVYLYQTSYGFASGQIPRRSQGTLLPLSVRTQGIESVEQCAMQGFNLVKQGKLSCEEPSCI